MEEMTSFFSKRADGYDTHMLTNVSGCKEGYEAMATLIPKSCQSLLDLGCGTGLELDEIFKVLPEIEVTGIDLTQEMLNKLAQKHPDKSIHLICGSYFDVPFSSSTYDCAISFQTLHHFSHDMKISRPFMTTFTKWFKALRSLYVVRIQNDEFDISVYKGIITIFHLKEFKYGINRVRIGIMIPYIKVTWDSYFFQFNN